MANVGFGFGSAPHTRWIGNGYFAGEPPATSDPDDPDGRARILNVPSRVRVFVYEIGTMLCVAETMSAADGTWQVICLDPTLFYTIIGRDGRGLNNAAIQDWVQPALMP